MIDYKKMGKRIREKRISNGFKSMAAFCDYIGDNYNYKISRFKLSDIENGVFTDRNNSNSSRIIPEIDIALLDILADIFKCNISYLIGEIDNRTFFIGDMASRTNLSVPAIQEILEPNKNLEKDDTEYDNVLWLKKIFFSHVLSLIIVDSNYENLMEDIVQLLDLSIGDKTFSELFNSYNNELNINAQKFLINHDFLKIIDSLLEEKKLLCYKKWHDDLTQK